jgi:hypothetical protein
VVCHNQQLKTGGLMLDRMDVAHPTQGAEVWEKVIQKLTAGMMPPSGMPKPDKADVDVLLKYLETSLDRAAAAKPDPGRAPLHRMNRAEYGDAVRDLLGLEVDTDSLLPPDDSSYGFDNIADVLGSSPALLDRYLTASRKISRLAVGDPSITPAAQTYRARPDLSQDKHVSGMPLGTRGGLLVHYNFPLDGEYTIKVKLARNTVDVIRGLEEPHQFETLVDGARVHIATIGGMEDTAAVTVNPTAAAQEIEGRLASRITVKAGPRDVGVTFVQKDSAESDQLLQPFLRTTIDPVDEVGLPHIDGVTISGPFNATGPGDTPSRRKIFICRPTPGGDDVACAKKIIANLERHAYRRPVSDRDLETPLGFYQRERNNKGSFDQGIESALRFILASPEFIFRFEPDPANVAPGSVYRISDLELASRLSFFLWSSIPDDELIDLAAQNKLHEPAVLAAQVRRMLADPRSEALVTNFAGQWLYLRNLKSVAPNVDEFPNFDDNLRQAFLKETDLFISSIIRGDRPVTDLLNADYTFVNERLARHYGIPNVYGSQFRRVTLTDPARRGLLGQGSILTVTSYATRTSPVLRGKWILTNILGTPPNPPPPNVPALKDNVEGGKQLSVRQRMEEHRKNDPCASCHKIMDPLGFALENFDAVGRWRSTDESGGPVDASGQLVDGTKVNGPVGLREALMKHPAQFASALTDKLFTYALGRGLDYHDEPAIRAIVRNAAQDNYRFSSLVLGIVNSTEFQMKRKVPASSEAAVRPAQSPAARAARPTAAQAAKAVRATAVAAVAQTPKVRSPE